MKKIFTIIMSFFALSHIAQPVMQYTNYISAGATGTIYSGAKPTSPGPAGAGVTWNFSSITYSQVGMAAVMQPSATPFGSSFPTANFAVQLSTSSFTVYGYNNVQPSFNDQLGNNISATGGSSYTPNPKQEMIFPWNYGVAFTDTYQCVSCGISTFTRTYDGYGTLIVNGFTITNVARVTSYFGGTSYYYNYYVTSPVLASIFSYDGSGTSSSFFDIGITTDIKEISGLSRINFYPNPAQNNFKVNNENSFEVKLELRNFLGSLVMENRMISANSNTSIDISNLSKGLYLVSLTNEKGNRSVSKLIVE